MRCGDGVRHRVVVSNGVIVAVTIVRKRNFIWPAHCDVGKTHDDNDDDDVDDDDYVADSPT